MCFQNVNFNDIDDDTTRWLCILVSIYMYIYEYDTDLKLKVMSRSTTGSYDRPVIEVAYREILSHSTETVWEMVAWEEWLGCRHDASPMFDIPESTPVWAQ